MKKKITVKKLVKKIAQQVPKFADMDKSDQLKLINQSIKKVAELN